MTITEYLLLVCVIGAMFIGLYLLVTWLLRINITDEEQERHAYLQPRRAPMEKNANDTASHINDLAWRINEWARRKGFWNIPADVQEMMPKFSSQTLLWLERLMKAQKMALVTTETSEQVEAIRKPNSETGLPGFTNEEEECADQIIRLLDYAAQYNLRIGEAIEAKMAVNEGRPYKHGKEF